MSFRLHYTLLYMFVVALIGTVIVTVITLFTGGFYVHLIDMLFSVGFVGIGFYSGWDAGKELGHMDTPPVGHDWEK